MDETPEPPSEHEMLPPRAQDRVDGPHPSRPSPRTYSRRVLLAGLAGTAAAAAGGWVLLSDRGKRPVVAGANGASGPSGPTASTPGTTTLPQIRAGEGIVVLVTLYGGNDGLNTLVPIDDARYLSGRGALAYQGADVLTLRDGFGLNPSLQGLKSLWDGGRLAIVRGVGYPTPNRSHFRSMDIWQSAVPDRAEITGWLGRWLDTLPHDPMRAIAIGSSVPLALVGSMSSAAAVNVGPIALPGGRAIASAYAKLATASPTMTPLARLVASSGADLLTVDSTLTRVLAAGAPTGSGTGVGNTNSLEVGGAAPPATSTTIPAGRAPTTLAPAKLQAAAKANTLAAQLDVVSRAIRGGASTRVYSVALGGFDTHAAEKATQAKQLAYLDEAITGLLGSLGADPRGSGVVVAVYSEFGRRVDANASGGTDHGTAGPVFIAGPAVKGGFYGEEPLLTDLDQGDLKFTTDFRSVYSTLLAKVLGADPAQILGGQWAPIAFL